MSIWIYTLKLHGGKFYVGSTTNIDLRFSQHVNGTGSRYRRKYPPIEILESELVSKSVAGFREDFQVKKMMGAYGIDNVRGGSYSQEELPLELISALTRELNHAAGACLKCGSMKHWVSNCRLSRETAQTSEAETVETVEKPAENPVSQTWYRCAIM